MTPLVIILACLFAISAAGFVATAIFAQEYCLLFAGFFFATLGAGGLTNQPLTSNDVKTSIALFVTAAIFWVLGFWVWRRYQR